MNPRWTEYLFSILGRMRYVVVRQRDEGRLIPRWRMGAPTGVAGELLVTEGRDERLRRPTTVARLVQPESGNDLLPPLIDARLVWVKHQTLVLTGFESIHDRDYAQTWMAAVDTQALHSIA